MLKEPLFAPLPIPFSAFSREASIRDPGRKARACSTIVGLSCGGYLSQSLEATGSHLGRRRRMQDALAFFTLFPSAFPRLGPQTGSRHPDVFGQSKLANV
jgi:hypothetical protein